MQKVRRILREETSGLHFRLILARLILAPLPSFVGSRFRAWILRLAGFRIGPGTQLFNVPFFAGSGNIYQRLIIGENCLVSVGCYFDLAEKITIGDRVGISPRCMLMTAKHDFHNPDNRVGNLLGGKIHVGNGAWLGTACIILPGITIGEGAVIGAGAVVTKDVPANTVVAGVPAKVIQIMQSLEEAKPAEIRREVIV